MLDVLIIGAGPVGLTMAALFSKYNISFHIIDKKLEPTKTSNALGVNARTLEMWQILNLTEKALSLGLPVSEAVYYLGSGQKIPFSFRQVQSEFPYNLFLPQAQTEQIYLQYLEERSINVDRGCNLINLQEGKDFVSADIQTSSGSVKKIDAKWLIACDGYHSTVREQIAMPYVKDDLSQHFLMMDCKIKESIKEMRLSIHANGLLILFPMRDAVRVVAEVSRDPQWKTAKQASLEIMQAIIQERSPFKLTVEQVVWTSAFWTHEQIIKHYRKGRIFFAGDAAHAHSPAGGQGMNTGIQDAFNLAWKLALVCQEKAKTSLLDSYEAERRPIAQRVIRDSGSLLRMMTASSGQWKWLRWFLFKFIMPRPMFQKKAAEHFTQLDVGYAPHQERSIIFSSAGKFVLLVYGQARNNEEINQWVEKQAADWVEVKFMASSNSNVSFSLIRPDMYVAFETKKIEKIQAYLTNMLGL